MYPPVFEIASADPEVIALLGSNPTRFYPFGLAPQKESRPYAVWQLVYGAPSNSLSCAPVEDNAGVQIDAYAKTVTQARDVSDALRDSFEASYAYVVSYNGEDWEVATGLFRVSFTAEFWVERPRS